MPAPTTRRTLLLTAMMAATAATASDNHYNSPLVMDRVVVTATKTENRIAEAPASISVVTSEQIMEQPAMTLNEMVEQSVGVESRKQSGRSGRETISIRGMDSSYTLIMVNGRRMSSSNAIVRGNDFDLAAIPKESIERIEVIRGPMSALYGSEALGGVVNIITRQPLNEWRTTVSADYSSPADGDGGEETMMGINTGGALIDNELYMNLSVNKSNRDAWKPYDGQIKEATALEERDTVNVSGNVNWFINDNHALDFDMSYSNYEREGLSRDGTAKDNSARLMAVDPIVRRNQLSVTHTGTWNFGETQLRAYREEVELDEYDSDTKVRNDITETSYTVDGSLTTVLGNHQITVGGDARQSELDNDRDLSKTGTAEVNQEAIFVQDEWQLAENWNLTYGGRLDHHEEFGEEISPRAYLVHNVNDRFIIKGGVGTAFKAPSLLQLNDEYILQRLCSIFRLKTAQAYNLIGQSVNI